MAFTLTRYDFDENGELSPVEKVELKDFKPWEKEGITKEEYLEREASLFCECEEPDDEPEYVESAVIPGVGRVNHHGYICRKCGKFVQIG